MHWNCAENCPWYCQDAWSNNKENVFSLKLSDGGIIETPAIIPRYHLNALTKLIEKGVLADGIAEDKALKFKVEMKTKAREAKLKEG